MEFFGGDFAGCNHPFTGKILNGGYGNSLALLFQVKVRSQTQHKITSEPYTKSKIHLSPRFRFNHEYLHFLDRVAPHRVSSTIRSSCSVFRGLCETGLQVG